jgi:hypothetical protein
MLRRLHTFGPDSTLLNPRADKVGLRLREWFSPAGHHVVVAFRERDTAKEFALRRLAGGDDARFLESFGAGVETKLALGKFCVMALKAIALEDGHHLARKVYGGGTEDGRDTEDNQDE